MSQTPNNLEVLFGFSGWQISKYGSFSFDHKFMKEDIDRFISINKCLPQSIIHLKRFIKTLREEFKNEKLDMYKMIDLIKSYSEYYMLELTTEEWPLNIKFPKD